MTLDWSQLAPARVPTSAAGVFFGALHRRGLAAELSARRAGYRRRAARRRYLFWALFRSNLTSARWSCENLPLRRTGCTSAGRGTLGVQLSSRAQRLAFGERDRGNRKKEPPFQEVQVVVSLPSDQSRSGSEGAATTPHGIGLALGSAPRRLTAVPIAPRNNADAAAFRGTMRKFVAGMASAKSVFPVLSCRADAASG